MGQWGALGYALAGPQLHPDPRALLRHAGHGRDHIAWGCQPVGATAHLFPSPSPKTRTAGTTSSCHLELRHSRPEASPCPPAAASLFQLDAGTWMVETNANGCGPGWGAPAPVSGRPRPGVDPGSGDLTLCYVGGNITVHGTIQGTVNSGQPGPRRQRPTARAVRGRRHPGGVAGVLGNVGSGGRAGRAAGLPRTRSPGRGGTVLRHGQSRLRGTSATPTSATRRPVRTTRASPTRTAVTNLATSNTAGQAVLRSRRACRLLTQYSSSTGGHTAGGTFAAVPDDGDAVCVAGRLQPVPRLHGEHPGVGRDGPVPAARDAHLRPGDAAQRPR